MSISLNSFMFLEINPLSSSGVSGTVPTFLYVWTRLCYSAMLHFFARHATQKMGKISQSRISKNRSRVSSTACALNVNHTVGFRTCRCSTLVQEFLNFHSRHSFLLQHKLVLFISQGDFALLWTMISSLQSKGSSMKTMVICSLGSLFLMKTLSVSGRSS